MPVFLLSPDSTEFPPARLANPDGLLAVGGDLSFERLLAAYSRGIFPWYNSETPILWWSPDPRCVLFPKKLHLPRSLKKTLRYGRFEFTVNRAFAEVIEHCAATPRPGQGDTWITPEMIAAYVVMHQQGKAHSVEVWENGELAGGLYGVALGRAFFGESMFYLRPDASKAAVAWLVPRLDELGFQIMDCQQETPHMLRFGAELVDRAVFLRIVSRAVEAGEATEFWQGADICVRNNWR